MAKAKKRERNYLQKVSIKGSPENVTTASVKPKKKKDEPKPVLRKK